LKFAKKNFRGRVFAELAFALSLRPTAWGYIFLGVSFFSNTPIPHYGTSFHIMKCTNVVHDGAVQQWCDAT
jgi:hypothetical protein